MQTKIILYIILGIIAVIPFYLYFNEEYKENESGFIPPPAFSISSKLTPMVSSTSSVSTENNIYLNKTLGLSMKLPPIVNLKNETAELRKYELGSGEDKLGQEYKYYEINFSENDNTESGVSIIIKVKEVPYTSIDEWLEKDITRGGYFPEDTVKFEHRNMFDEDVFFGFDDWYNINSLPQNDEYNSEYVYTIKNNLLYRIEINNLSQKESDVIWNSIQLNTL